jgi:uncharacterized protein (TIGR02444 family)
MRFWTWAVEVYARPGVADACLELQDRHDQCVPYLLWAAWAAAEQRVLTPDRLRQGAAVAERWQTVVVAPLRGVRRAMKATVEGIPDEGREALRAEVKALELKAEKALIEALENLSPAPSEAPLPAATALGRAAQVWHSGSLSEAALQRLAQTLS